MPRNDKLEGTPYTSMESAYMEFWGMSEYVLVGNLNI